MIEVIRLFLLLSEASDMYAIDAKDRFVKFDVYDNLPPRNFDIENGRFFRIHYLPKLGDVKYKYR